MKKIILLGRALLMSTTVLFAQSTMSGSDARIGIKAGVNLSTIRASGFDGAKAINDATKQNVEVTLHAINSEIDRDIDAINLYL